MSLSVGDRVGPYEVTGLLGAGGMGEVYRARDTRLDRTVAVKVLPEHVASDPVLKQRFEREAKALAMLSHPHICPVFDVGEHRGIDFLVMEYLEGETLASRLSKGPLPLDQALRCAGEIADALDKAHRQGVVHRDLKPGNIMLTKNGAKLLDFGLAKLRSIVRADAAMTGAPTVGSLSGTGTIVGTLQYMAPEQLEGREADQRTDIFAFGGVLYEMVTGKKAFEGASQASLISAILKDDPRPMSVLDPMTPATLDHVVRRCLAKDPDDRWQDVRDMAVALRWSADGAPLSSPAAPQVRVGTRLAWALAGAIVAGAALVVPAMRYLSAPAPLVTRLDVSTPPTTDPFSFALSPDGRQLVFAATGNDGSRLWLRRLDQTDARSLVGTEGGGYPFWAPDGRAIGFFADGKLKRMDLPSGSPLTLADAPFGRGGAWNADDVIVFAPSGSGSVPIMRIAATGGTPVPVTRAVPGQGHRYPQFLRDGRRFLFSVYPGPREALGVYVGSLDQDMPVHVGVTETGAIYAPAGYLVHVSQGVLVAQPFDETRATLTGEPVPLAQMVGVDTGGFRGAFSVSSASVLAHRIVPPGRRQLVWVDRTGTVLGAVGARDDSSLSQPELSPDGRRVALVRAVQGDYDVWVIEIGSSVPTRLTFDGAADVTPLWMRDSSRLIFTSSRNGTWDLFEKPASGAAGERPLLISPQDKVPLAVSPDGRFLLYAAQDPNGLADLWALPLIGESRPFPIEQTRFDEVQGQFSPDGRWLAYASNQSGRYEIYVRTFPEPGGQWQVSTAGGIYPRWGRDGRELFYVAPDGRLMAVPIRVAADRRALDPGVPAPLFQARLATGTAAPQTGVLSKAQYAVAPDGRFLLNMPIDDGTPPPITVVLNWTTGLGP